MISTHPSKLRMEFGSSESNPNNPRTGLSQARVENGKTLLGIWWSPSHSYFNRATIALRKWRNKRQSMQIGQIWITFQFDQSSPRLCFPCDPDPSYPQWLTFDSPECWAPGSSTGRSGCTCRFRETSETVRPAGGGRFPRCTARTDSPGPRSSWGTFARAPPPPSSIPVLLRVGGIRKVNERIDHSRRCDGIKGNHR